MIGIGARHHPEMWKFGSEHGGQARSSNAERIKERLG